MQTRRGFTLVELMVAVALLGLVMTMVFSLFSTTSDALKEADSLVDSLDRTRFAMQRLSSDIGNAAAFGSPDSHHDRWVPNKSYKSAGDTLRVAGVAGYKGWQDHGQTDGLLNKQGLLGAHTVKNKVRLSYDGFIVMGAMDFPQSFEITDVAFDSGGGTGRATGATIPLTERGIFKLLANDPFYTDTGAPAGLTDDSGRDDGDDAADNSLEVISAVLTDQLEHRVIRVMDRNGNMQLSGIKAGATFNNAASSDSTTPGVSFEFRSPLLVQNNDADASDGADYAVGLQRKTVDDDDVGYDAALIDAYWYHVESDPREPRNFRLVRERLDAAEVAQHLASAAGSFDPEDDLPTDGGTDKVIISDRVADFQVWFDCADTNGNVKSKAWLSEWATPKSGGADKAACMDPADPAFGQARMAHIRLSVRTRYERKDAPDDPAGFFRNASGAVDPNVAPGYFDLIPDAPGAARVVTVQNDVSLNNFAMRNIRPPSTASGP